MAKDINQKQKLLYLAKIFVEKTDEDHGLTVNQLIQLLSVYHVNVTRKTLYQDLDELRSFGFDIISEQRSREVIYFLASRMFEMAELKLLVDSVQSSRFITKRKSDSLIRKLESMASEYDARKLQRQVITAGRVKPLNENILINVDNIYSAINDDRQISFQYFKWTPEKKQELRHEGKRYVISPWYMVWNHENYYMIGCDDRLDMIKHFRVDKMIDVVVENDFRKGQHLLKEMNIAAYHKSLFGMLGGDTTRVTLECHNDMAGVLIDRFGKDVIMLPKDEEHFIAHVDVVPSNQFLGWIIGLGPCVKITAPEFVVHQVKDVLKDQLAMYS